MGAAATALFGSVALAVPAPANAQAMSPAVSCTTWDRHRGAEACGPVPREVCRKECLRPGHDRVLRRQYPDQRLALGVRQGGMPVRPGLPFRVLQDQGLRQQYWAPPARTAGAALRACV